MTCSSESLCLFCDQHADSQSFSAVQCVSETFSTGLLAVQGGKKIRQYCLTHAHLKPLHRSNGP